VGPRGREVWGDWGDRRAEVRVRCRLICGPLPASLPPTPPPSASTLMCACAIVSERGDRGGVVSYGKGRSAVRTVRLSRSRVLGREVSRYRQCHSRRAHTRRRTRTPALLLLHLHRRRHRLAHERARIEIAIPVSSSVSTSTSISSVTPIPIDARKRASALHIVPPAPPRSARMRARGSIPTTHRHFSRTSISTPIDMCMRGAASPARAPLFSVCGNWSPRCPLDS
jgi:hypothetical protein